MSDAGTPLVTDPGFVVARAVIAAGLPVHPIPGASSLLAALCIAGLPADRVLFAGFLPPKSGARRRRPWKRSARRARPWSSSRAARAWPTAWPTWPRCWARAPPPSPAN